MNKKTSLVWLMFLLLSLFTNKANGESYIPLKLEGNNLMVSGNLYSLLDSDDYPLILYGTTFNFTFFLPEASQYDFTFEYSSTFTCYMFLYFMNETARGLDWFNATFLKSSTGERVFTTTLDQKVKNVIINLIFIGTSPGGTTFYFSIDQMIISI